VTIRRPMRIWASVMVLTSIAPAAVAGQTAQPPAQPEASTVAFVMGGAFTALRGACQTCEDTFPYRQAGSVFGAVRYRPTPRMDVGGEILWVPARAAAGDHIRTTHLDAVAQFRPWAGKGFFLKGGAGIAFVRNWVDVPGAEAITSKALSIEIGGGWAFRRANRLGVELFAAQHAAALGDIKTSTTDVPDVIGNFWSIGGAIVIR
jgi:hypothetical protein